MRPPVQIGPGAYLIAEHDSVLRWDGNPKELQNPETVEALQRHLPESSGTVFADPRWASMVELILTDACNLKCKYCYSAIRRAANAMDPRIAHKAIDHAIRAAYMKRRLWGSGGTAKLSFHGGGEPTVAWSLLQDCTETAESAAKRLGVNLRLAVATNGVLSRSHVEYLVTHQFEVRVSMDGLEADHDAHRPVTGGLGSFAYVARTLDWLEELGAHYKIAAAFCADTVHNIPDFVRQVCARWPRVREVGISRVIPSAETAATGMAPPTLEEFTRVRDEGIRVGRDMGVPAFAAMRSTIEHHIINNPSWCTPYRMVSVVVLPDGSITRCSEAPDTPGAMYGQMTKSGADVSVHQIQIRETPEASGCAICPVRKYCDQWCLNPRIREGTADCRYFQKATKDFFVNLLGVPSNSTERRVESFDLAGHVAKIVGWTGDAEE